MKAPLANMHYKIGQAARKLGIAVETIRMYERCGILLVERKPSGQRIFTNHDLHWIRCIRSLIKDQGLNIEGIRRLLAMMPCWSFRSCAPEDRAHCPAFRGALQPCWTMKSRIPLNCRAKNCRECNVYQSVTSCTNLKMVIYQS